MYNIRRSMTVLAGMFLSFNVFALEAVVELDQVGVKAELCGEEARAFLHSKTATEEGCRYFTFDVSHSGGTSIMSLGLTAISTKKPLTIQYVNEQDPTCTGTTTVCKINGFVIVGD